MRAAGQLAPLLLVDGSGILHHRHAGIASHLGVAAALPTIGVTKKLLCGQVDIEGMKPFESRPVLHQQRLIGMALRPTAGSRRPIFLSPGHRVDVPFAEQVVGRLLAGHRLPEPIYWADRLSRQAAGTLAKPQAALGAGIIGGLSQFSHSENGTVPFGCPFPHWHWPPVIV